MTILVTGATGFVGSAVARRLQAAGQTLRLLARPGGDRRNLAGIEADIAEGDLMRPDTLAPALSGCRALFHVAADYRLWVPDEAAMLRANVEGTRRLMEAALAAGVERIVYTSSVAVLGIDPSGRPSDETTPSTESDMVGIYKRSKFLAEAEVRRLIAERRLPAVIVNPSTPIGPRDIKPTPTGRIVIEAAMGRMPAFVETGLNVAHVDDVAEGHWLAFQKGRVGERYILGGEDMTLGQILAVIAGLAGRKAPTVKLPHGLVMPIAWAAETAARLGWVREPFATTDGIRMAKKMMYFSSAKAERDLGYRHRPGAVALADAHAWFRDQGRLV